MRYILREKFFRITEDSDITDETGRPVYQVRGRLFSLHHTLVMSDLAGNEIYTIRQHLVALRPTFEITRAGQEVAEIRKKLFAFLGEHFTIDIPGPDDLEVQGNILDHQDHYELQNYTSILHGNHTVKFGTRLRGIRDANSQTCEFNGEFTF